MKTFTAIIRHDPENGGAWVEVPFDAREEFGSGRPKVKAVFDGKVVYRGTLVKMGGSCYILGVRREFREKLGKKPGDEILVELQPDTETRVVQVPPELIEAMAGDEAVQKYFKQLSYTHQREYAEYISEAKKVETRHKRAGKAVVMMRKNL